MELRKGLKYDPTEKQKKFHASNAEVTLFGGAAGGGKSIAVLMEGFISMIEQPGSHGLILRRTFPELESSLILVSMRLFPQDICRYNSLKHCWFIQTAGEESVLSFGYARHLEEAIERYRSSEFTFLGFDELTHFDESVFRELISRVRTSTPGHKCRIVAASNPGNVGHQWVKKYFGIGVVPAETIWTPESSEDDPEPMSRCFIPAKLDDNPHIMEADPGYLRRLSGLPPIQRKMLRDGDWSTPEGLFWSELTPAHFVRPIPIGKDWKIYRGIDYGFSAPFCCLWVGSSPDGHFYVFRESKIAGLRDTEQAALISSLSEEKVDLTRCDPSMRAKNASGVSPLENYISAGIPAIPADNNRVMGWMALRNAFALHPDGTPILRIFDTCIHLRKELEGAVRGRNDPDDIDSNCEDHAMDALRYCFSNKFEIPQAAKKDPYAHLNPESRAEWEAIAKRRAEVKKPMDALQDMYIEQGSSDDDDFLI